MEPGGESIRMPGGNQENMEVVTTELGLERFIHEREVEKSHLGKSNMSLGGGRQLCVTKVNGAESWCVTLRGMFLAL